MSLSAEYEHEAWSELEAKILENRTDLRDVLAHAAMWLGKMIADGAHKNSTLPNDCVRTLQRVEAWLERMEGAL